MTPYKILQVRRGLKADLPTLEIGEIGFCTDTKEMYIGTASGNVKVSRDYSPSNPANWQGAPPTTIDQALDRIAHTLSIVFGGSIV